MKLNLLPTSAAKGKSSGFAWVVCVVMIAASAGAAFMMGQQSKKKIDFWTQKAEEVKPAYEAAGKVSGYATDVVNNSKGVIVNAALAKAMIAQCSVYPAFYDKLMPYIPSFFRITQMNATPVSADTVTVTLRGVIQTREQYANIMLAFNRIPDVQTVTRSGFSIVDQYIPNLIQTDQTGRPVTTDYPTNVPDDPMLRLQYFIGRGSLTGYDSNRTFGSGQPGYRGAMPKWSEITISLVMPGKLQGPDPSATLRGAAAGSSSAGTSTASPMPGAMGMPGGAPAGIPGPMGSSPMGSGAGGVGQDEK